MSHFILQSINIKNDSSIDNNIQKNEYSVSNNMSIVEYIFNDSIDWDTGKKFGWKGNEKCWNSVLREYKLSEKSFLVGELEKLKSDSSVVIFGAGETCKTVLKILKKSNINVTGIAVSDINNNPCDVENIQVQTINAFHKNSKIIIAIFDEIESKKVRNSLNLEGYHDIVRFNIFDT